VQGAAALPFREMAAGNPMGPLEPADHAEEARRRVAILYRDRAASLRRQLRMRCGSSEEASEILHDAFARLLGAPGLDGVRDQAAFLNRILRNLLVDRHRRRFARPLLVDVAQSEPAVAPEQGHALELEQMRELYRTLVASLPPRMREVFLLHRLHGRSYKEIAQSLNISVRTVEWHIAQAIARIGRGLDRK